MERYTRNPTQASVEMLTFTPEEAALGTLAAESLVFYSLQQERPDPLVVVQPQIAIAKLRRISEFTGSFADLAAKLSGDQPAMLFPDEIGQLGHALYYYGFHSVGRARELLAKDASSMTESGYKTRASRVRQTAYDVFALFKQLEPIAALKEIEWTHWPEPASTADPDLKPERGRRRT